MVEVWFDSTPRHNNNNKTNISMEKLFNILGGVMIALFAITSVLTAIGHVAQGNYFFGFIVSIIAIAIIKLIYKSIKD